MRAVGIFVVFLLCRPLVPGGEKPLLNKTSARIFHFHPKHSLPVQFPSAASNKNTIDTAQLKQSDWYATVTKNIEESEYEIQPARGNEYSAPNLKQNLQSVFSPDHFRLQPGNNDVEHWELDLKTEGVYAGKEKLFSTRQRAVPFIEKNKISFHHGNDFTIEYINNENGVRQNFIINKTPPGNPETINLKLETNENWYVNKVHSKEIHFARRKGNEWDKKIVYNDLKVWDATNKELDASFSVEGNEISINVNTAGAVYPITIDPLSTSPNTSLAVGVSGDYFGISVASAGDVNKDGYSDVIVGAHQYPSGKGKAYLFEGSSTGISATAVDTLVGAASGDKFGYSVSSAGDINGDGYSDVIIGAYGVSSGLGAAYVYLGSSGGLVTPASFTLSGLVGGGNFGISVACAGDVNGDGFSDVIVGAQVVNSSTGALYLYCGSSTGIPTTPTEIIPGVNSSSSFGNSVAGAGDVNGDGYSDVIVGAPNDSGNVGAAYIYFGSALPTPFLVTPSVQLSGITAGDYFGISVSSAGDVNGDGYADFIVGAPQRNSSFGAVYVYLGSSGTISTSPVTTLNGTASGSFGVSVACAGDVNGDGYSDIIIGANTLNTATGAIYLYQGSSTGISTTASQTINGLAISTAFGISVVSAGDVNGDGYSDIIIGAPNTSTNTGAAYVYHGSPSGISSTGAVTLNGLAAGDTFGTVACAGDVNADGYSDVIIGADQFYSGVTHVGVAYLYLGSSTGLPTTASQTLTGFVAGGYFGESVSCAGDVNGDGYSDVIIGAPQANSSMGAAYLYTGGPGGLTFSITLPGITSNGQFGVSVAGAGDIDGDGYADIIVGAYAAFSGLGAAYIYMGTNTGLSTTPTLTLNGNTPGESFGVSVACAGDVNGDGFSDVIVGAWQYSTAEGRAYVYHGSQAGLSSSPNEILEITTGISGDQFGVCVASAGDVNGDGYGDVIVGAHGVSSVRGAAYIFLGSSSGTAVFPATTLNGISSNDEFGISVSCAGDVNGDGYSDVIVGAPGVSSGKGAAYIFNGGSSGLSSTPSATLNGVSASDGYGQRISWPGDINGDGFSEVIAGAEGVNSSTGAAYFYYGNSVNGLRNNLRLYNADTVTPINHASIYDPNLFGAGLYAKSFLGRQNGKMVWETEKNGVAFSGNPITNSVSYTLYQTDSSDLGLTGRELKSVIAKQSPSKATYIRARVKYDRATAITGQVYGPWRYPESFLRGIRDIGAVALPLKFISFTAVRQNEEAILHWVTTNETSGTVYEVQRSNDGIHFAVLTTVAANNPGQSDYQWTDQHINPGKNFYRIRAADNNTAIYSDTRMLNFSVTMSLYAFPNPAKAFQSLAIRDENIRAGEQVDIKFLNQAGQLGYENNMIAGENGKISIRIPGLPAGIYYLRISLKAEGIINNGTLIIE